MSIIKKAAGVGMFGLAGLAARKKLNPMMLVSPAASLIQSGKKKKVEEPDTMIRRGTAQRDRGMLY